MSDSQIQLFYIFIGIIKQSILSAYPKIFFTMRVHIKQFTYFTVYTQGKRLKKDTGKYIPILNSVVLQCSFMYTALYIHISDAQI